MTRSSKLPVPVSNREKQLGFFYTAFELLALPYLLRAMNGLLIRPLSSVWINFLFFSLNFLLLTVILHRFLRRSLSYVGQHPVRLLAVAVAGFGMYMIANAGLSLLISQLFPDFSNPNDQSIGAMAGVNFTVTAIGTVLLVPLAEELIHRGLIFGSLLSRNRTAAYLISALFFAAVHMAQYVGSTQPLTLVLALVQYLPAGLVLAWSYECSGSIFAPVLIHTAVNVLGILSMR